jgi:hypothetical protein
MWATAAATEDFAAALMAAAVPSSRPGPLATGAAEDIDGHTVAVDDAAVSLVVDVALALVVVVVVVVAVAVAVAVVVVVVVVVVLTDVGGVGLKRSGSMAFGMTQHISGGRPARRTRFSRQVWLTHTAASTSDSVNRRT